jgi:hypothetical protein
MFTSYPAFQRIVNSRFNTCQEPGCDKKAVGVGYDYCPRHSRTVVATGSGDADYDALVQAWLKKL